MIADSRRQCQPAAAAALQARLTHRRALKYNERAEAAMRPVVTLLDWSFPISLCVFVLVCRFHLARVRARVIRCCLMMGSYGHQAALPEMQ
jgi:hypothetical protein